MAKAAAVGKEAVGAGRIRVLVVGLAVVLALGVASAAEGGTGLDGRAADAPAPIETKQIAPVRPVSLQQSGGGGSVGSGADGRPPSFDPEGVSGERQGGGSLGSDRDSRPPSLY